MCGLPITAESLGGPFICPRCDCGNGRDGKPWTSQEFVECLENYKRNMEKYENQLKHRPNRYTILRGAYHENS